MSSEHGDGIGGINKTIYRYGDMKAEHASPQYPASGRGMLGFLWVKSLEESTGVKNYTEFYQEWPYFGQVIKSETKRVKGGRNLLLKLSNNTRGCYQSEGTTGGTKPSSATAACGSWAAGKVYFPFAVTTCENSWDLNEVQMPTQFSRNAYGGYADNGGTVRQFGDLTQGTLEIGQGGVLRQRKVIANQYQPARTDGLNWESGRLIKATVTSSQY